MTEAEWLACDDLPKLLAFLRGRVSERKLRLFGVACCHRIWPLLKDEIGRQAVEVAERIAEGGPHPADLVTFAGHVHYVGFSYIDGYQKGRTQNIAYHAVGAAYNTLPDVFPPGAFAGYDSLRPDLMQVPVQAAWAVAHSWRRKDKEEYAEADFFRDLREQVPLLRDVVGPLPFRAVRLAPSWAAWEGGSAVTIAAGAYEDRAFDRLPILADALEEAGCTDADILTHLRSPGPHVRGCWALDLVLGKR